MNARIVWLSTTLPLMRGVLFVLGGLVASCALYQPSSPHPIPLDADRVPTGVTEYAALRPVSQEHASLIGSVARSVQRSARGATPTIVEYFTGSGLVESAQRADTLIVARTTLRPLMYRSHGRYYDIALDFSDTRVSGTIRELWSDSVRVVSARVPGIPVTIWDPYLLLQAAPLDTGYRLRFGYFRPDKGDFGVATASVEAVDTILDRAGRSHQAWRVSVRKDTGSTRLIWIDQFSRDLLRVDTPVHPMLLRFLQ